MFPAFGTDGIRGVANKEISPKVSFALAQAASAVLGSRRFLIGRDTRISGSLLEASLVSGFCSAGVDVELLGVTTTPGVAWVSAQENVPAIMISASHNPFYDNGLKVFGSGGKKLSQKVEAEIQVLYESFLSEETDPLCVEGDAIGVVHVSDEKLQGWERSLISSVPEGLLSDLHVVLDCAHGSAFVSAPRIFSALGITTTVIGDKPDGVNINTGFGSTDTVALQQKVVEHDADAGLAFDGDADRLIAVDNKGNQVDGDRVLAILATNWQAKNMLEGSTVAVTVMTNLGFHHAMKDIGIATVSTSVGDRQVLEAMDASGYVLGGEQSGHIICRKFATTGDGILSGVQLLMALVESKRSFAELSASVLERVPQVLKNVRFSDRSALSAVDLREQIAVFEKEFAGKGRVLVRASGTEPLLRVMVEHEDESVASAVCEKLVECAQSFVSDSS